MTIPAYHDPIQNDLEFRQARKEWRTSLARDNQLHQRALELWQEASKYKYGYHWEWNGVPVIRWPDDVMLLQELIWTYKPALLIESGVARGGGTILSASLMAGAGLVPNVLGIDIAVSPHTKKAVADSIWTAGIELVESDSTSLLAIDSVKAKLALLTQGQIAFLTLDSNHSEQHVLSELQLLATLLPVGSIVLVADTIIEELPEQTVADRPWSRQNSPLSALNKFLAMSRDFTRMESWDRRCLLGEFRDGIIMRVAE